MKNARHLFRFCLVGALLVAAAAHADVIQRDVVGDTGLLLIQDDFTDEKYASVHLGGFEGRASSVFEVSTIYKIRYELSREHPVILVRDVWDLDGEAGRVKWRIDGV